MFMDDFILFLVSNNCSVHLSCLSDLLCALEVLCCVWTRLCVGVVSCQMLGTIITIDLVVVYFINFNIWGVQVYNLHMLCVFV